MFNPPYFAIFLASFSSMVVGSLWYGPLFGAQWMKLIGIKKPEKMTKEVKRLMMRSYGTMFIFSLFMAYVLSFSLEFANTYLGATGPSTAFMGAFWNWLGFIAPVSVSAVLWEKKSWKLFVLNSGYYLVTLSVMGLILLSV